jgi:hypothetical protein
MILKLFKGRWFIKFNLHSKISQPIVKIVFMAAIKFVTWDL